MIWHTKFEVEIIEMIQILLHHTLDFICYKSLEGRPLLFFLCFFFFFFFFFFFIILSPSPPPSPLP